MSADLPPRTIPVPFISSEVETILHLAQQIQLADPRSPFYHQTPLPPTHDFSVARRALYYLSLLYEDSDNAYAQLRADLNRALATNTIYQQAIKDLPPSPSTVYAPILSKPKTKKGKTSKAANTAALLSLINAGAKL